MNKNKQVKSHQKNDIIRVEGKYAFRRGDTFNNFEQVTDRLQAHTQESLVYYWIRDSRLVKYAHTKISRKIDEQLQYYSVKFSCIFGGQRFKSKANGLRPGKRPTRQIDCPAFIALRATKCGRKLEVIDVCNDHTHEISEQAVEELPQKRRPSQGLLEEIQELLHLNVDKKVIIEYVKQKENKNILKKDLFNMTAHLRLGSSRSGEDQKTILQRIALSATEDAIQNVVIRRLYQFDSDYPLSNQDDSLKSSQNTLDVFDTSTPSAIDFITLSPEIDLLNTTDGVKDYHELLDNRVAVEYGETETIKEKESNTKSIAAPENDWTEEAPMTVVYKDFICADDTSYAYNELALEKPRQVCVQVSNPHSPVSNHSQDLDDKEYFNDLILISPGDGIYTAEDESLVREECSDEIDGGDEVEMAVNASDELPIESSQVDDGIVKQIEVKKMKRKELPKYLARKTRQMIINCRNCGTNARLIRAQVCYLKGLRHKLLHQTDILRLKKKKLKAEIETISRSESM